MANLIKPPCDEAPDRAKEKWHSDEQRDCYFGFAPRVPNRNTVIKETDECHRPFQTKSSTARISRP